MAGTVSQITATVPNLQLMKPIVDEFIKSSFIFDTLPIVEMAQPGINLDAWTYTYTRLTTQSTAATRPVNTDYTEGVAEGAKYNVALSIFGGKFSLDRSMAFVGFTEDWLGMQLKQKRKAAIAKLNDLFINGDTGSDANAFDGLDVIATANSMLYNSGSYIDLSTSAKIQENAHVFDDMFNLWLAEMTAGKPTGIFVNAVMKAKMISVAKHLSLYTRTMSDVESGSDSQYDRYNGVPIIDLQQKSGLTTDVVATDATRTIDGSAVTNVTDIYGAKFDTDALHGVGPQRGNDGSSKLLNIYMPNLTDRTEAGINRAGAVEIIMGLAATRTKGVGAFKNIKVAV